MLSSLKYSKSVLEGLPLLRKAANSHRALIRGKIVSLKLKKG